MGGPPADAQGRPRRALTEGLWDVKLLTLLLVIVVGVLVSHFVHPVPLELRWSLLVLLLVGIALSVVQAVYRRTVRVPPLDPPKRDEEGTLGELNRLVKVLKRADRGLPYSQGMVALRAREAFLALVRSELGLEPEEMQRLLDDTSEVRRTVRNPILRRFLADTDPGEDRPHAPSVLQRGLPESGGGPGEFRRRMERVLEAMGKWP